MSMCVRQWSATDTVNETNGSGAVCIAAGLSPIRDVVTLMIALAHLAAQPDARGDGVLLLAPAATRLRAPKARSEADSPTVQALISVTKLWQED